MPDPKGEQGDEAGTATATANDETNETKEFMAELDKVLDEDIAASQSEDESPEKDEPTKKPGEGKEGDADPEKKGDEEASDQGEDGGDDEPTVSEELVERAVRAGLSMKEAKTFTDADVLQSVVTRLEEAAQKKPSEDGEETDGDEDGEKGKKAADDLLAKIPDLDPEEFDEKVVGAFKGVKEIVKAQQEAMQAQQETIAALQTQIKQSAEARGNWVDAEVAKLGKDYEDVFGKGNEADISDSKQKAARAKLGRYIKFAREEAKAEGKKLSNEDVFKQALGTAFADKMKSVKGAKTADAAAQRAKRSVNRPRDTTGRFASEDGGVGNEATDEEREADAVKAVEAFMEEA